MCRLPIATAQAFRLTDHTYDRFAGATGLVAGVVVTWVARAALELDHVPLLEQEAGAR